MQSPQLQSPQTETPKAAIPTSDRKPPQKQHKPPVDGTTEKTEIVTKAEQITNDGASSGLVTQTTTTTTTTTEIQQQQPTVPVVDVHLIAQPVQQQSQSQPKPVENVNLTNQETIEIKTEEIHTAPQGGTDVNELPEDNEFSQNNLEISENPEMTASMIQRRIITEDQAKAALAERRRLARVEAERQAEMERQRLEAERLAEQQRQAEEEERQRKLEEETLRLVEEQRKAEELRLQQAIEVK